jgi:hypothetical protein
MVASPFSILVNCIELTGCDTCTALDTLGSIDHMRILYASLDSIYGALTCTSGTTAALISVDLILHKVLTYVSRTLLVNDMSNILIAEVSESGKNGVRSRLTKTAQRTCLDVVAKLFHLIKVFHLTVSACDLIEKLKKTNSTDTARYALTAGLIHGKFKEELSDVNHTVVFVHNDKSA